MGASSFAQYAQMSYSLRVRSTSRYVVCDKIQRVIVGGCD